MVPRHAMSRCTRQRPEHAAGCRQGLSRLVPGPATAGHHEDTVGVVDKQLFAVCKPIAARNNHLVHLRALRSVNNETLMDHANHSPPVLLASLRYGTHAACLSPSVHALMATLCNELADLPGRIDVRLQNRRRSMLSRRSSSPCYAQTRGRGSREGRGTPLGWRCSSCQRHRRASEPPLL